MYDDTVADKTSEQADPAVYLPARMDHSQLADYLAAAFRDHPHINNVMTHIGGANWQGIEHALAELLDADRPSPSLSRLARNILQLICAERGVTGRVLKPYVASLLERIAPGDTARLHHLLQARLAVIDPKRSGELGIRIEDLTSASRHR